MFAGVAYDDNGYAYPTTAGHYCEWAHQTIDQSAQSKTFDDFFKTLKLECETGEPATLVWHVAEDTPDLVYYQVKNFFFYGRDLKRSNSTATLLNVLMMLSSV